MVGRPDGREFDGYAQADLEGGLDRASETGLLAWSASLVLAAEMSLTSYRVS
jgi:hypothetical protein